MLSFGHRLRRLRTNRKLVQDQVGEALGVGGESVSRYELDLTWPPVEKVFKLAKFFDVSINYLLLGDEVDIAAAEMIDKELLEQFLKIRDLPVEDKEALKRVLKSFTEK